MIWVVLGLRVMEFGRGGGGANPGVLLVTLMALAFVWLVDEGVVVVGKLALEEEREGWRLPVAV